MRRPPDDQPVVKAFGRCVAWASCPGKHGAGSPCHDLCHELLYEEGLLKGAEIEPRVKTAKELLTRLQAKVKAQEAQPSEDQQLRLVIGQLQDFAGKIREG